MGNTLDSSIKEITSLSDRIKKEEEVIRKHQEKLGWKEDVLREMVREMQDKMKKGEKLENPIEDYCYFHYGAEAGEYLERTRQFLEEITGFPEEKILVNHSGGHSTSTQIGLIGRSLRFPRRISLGRLSKEPTCQIEYPSRKVLAIVSCLKWWDENKGWTADSNPLYLGTYLDSFVKTMLPIGAKPEERGFRVDEILPLDFYKEYRIGGSVEYDNGLTRSSLIVGTERVDRYLADQNLRVTRTEVKTAAIPEV